MILNENCLHRNPRRHSINPLYHKREQRVIQLQLLFSTILNENCLHRNLRRHSINPLYHKREQKAIQL